MRTRIAATAAAAILVAGGSAVALQASSHNGGTPQLTATSPRATATASGNSNPSPSPTARPSVTTSASPGPSSGTPSRPASGSPSSNPATTPDPHHVVDAAWLAPHQLPFADTFQWTAQPATDHPLSSTVFYYAKDTVLQALTVCGDPAKLLTRTIGTQGTTYFAPPDGSGNAASQFIFFFVNAASAQQAFAWLQSQYGSACMPGSGVTITKTAGDATTSAAWLSRKPATGGPVDLAPYNREYFVLRGSTIGYVSISSVANLPTTYNDAAQFSTIAAHLCVYGGPCD